MQIHLVEPAPAGHNVYDLSRLPRLGLPLIGTLLEELGHDVRISCEVLAPVDLERCLHADLVGISATTATAPAAYRLADLLAEAGVRVVLGGPHVTYCAGEALEHAPFVVRGEGQETILDLVSCLEGRGELAEVSGLSQRGEDGKPLHNPDRPRCAQAAFERLPAPRLSLIDGHERMSTMPVMTQWGCPFDCEFCSVSAQFSRRVRHRRADQVVEELRDLGASRVFFYDDNFVVNKARTSALLRAMLDADVQVPFFAQMRAQAALHSGADRETDDEFLGLLARSGAEMVMLGIETITDQALAEINKRQNVETVVRAIGAFHRHRIAVHGMFIAGLDVDDARSAEATADFARRIGIDTFQLMVETPLPGTRLWDRVVAEQRVFVEDWSLFDGHHVVMQPAKMTPLTLQLSVLRAMRRFYSWPTIASSGLATTLAHLPEILGMTNRRTLLMLPNLARAARARQYEEVPVLLRAAVPERALARLTGAFWLPALRLYARLQLRALQAQPTTRAHLAALAALEAL